MGFSVYWSDQWDKLAEDFYQYLEENPTGDPLRPECVVVNSSAMESWLRHYFVYERAGQGRQRVLANWDVQQLYPFINDWLFRMMQPGNPRRNPRLHPYSRECLGWRLYQLLDDGLLSRDSFGELRHYCREGGGEVLSPPRRFNLAGVLARLFDEYQTYRPEMLDAWEHDRPWQGLEPGWQKELWSEVTAGDPNSYLESFRNIQGRIDRCGIAATYERVTVFGVSVMPPVYLHFLQQLGKLLPVRLYTFNPCRELWDQDLQFRGTAERAVRMQGLEDSEYLKEREGNPLLTGLGKGCQSYLAEVLDRCAGDVEDSLFGADEDDFLLHRIQQDLRTRRTFSAAQADEHPAIRTGDESLQIHICHSPMREVEVLRDFLYRQFAENPGLQPRDIQVLVSDLPAYAPFINAVFDTRAKAASSTIPYSISDRSLASTSPTAKAFMTLLGLPDSRFKASELMDLLETESVAGAFSLDGHDMTQLRRWIRESGIRWGRDRQHLEDLGFRDMEATVTWQSGADRMLLGYAMGQPAEEGGCALVGAGAGEELAPFHDIEGGSVEGLGKLLRFIDLARGAAMDLREERTPEDWSVRLNHLLDSFFVSTNTTYADVTMVRSAVQDLARTAEAAGMEGGIGIEIVRRFLQARLDESAPARDLYHNAVMFSPLQAMRSTPRKVICLLGMDDGVFPRRDRRASFDLVRKKMLRADRSHRRDDRLAFLEALMSARSRLYLSYVGRTDQRNEPMPPSTVISELKDYLQTAFQLPDARVSRDGEKLLFCETLHHLQAFHPDYFAGDKESELYSYSSTNFDAARVLKSVNGDAGHSGVERAASGRDHVADAGERARDIPLEALKKFMVNPAREFHRKVLQVDFADFSDLGLADAEPFKIEGGLEQYSLNQDILEAQLSGLEVDVTRKTLSQQGRLMLGKAGEAEFFECWNNVSRLLDGLLGEEFFGAPKTLRELLALKMQAEGKEYSIEAGCRRITGVIRLIEVDGQPWVLEFRPASIKAKDRLQVWLTHLFATIAIKNESGRNVRTLLVGKGDRYKPKAEELASAPASGETAPYNPLQILGGFLNLYQSWHEAGRLMPFAPETSGAYFKKLSEKKKDKDEAKPEAVQQSALDEAGKKWLSGYDYSFTEGDDRDFYQAFGEAGPMGGIHADDFREIAVLVGRLMKGGSDAGPE